MSLKVVTNNEVKALAPHTFKYSVAILEYHSKNNNFVGSGTLVQLGSRFFIATAAHNLTDDNHVGISDDCLFIACKKRTSQQLPFLSRKPSAEEEEPAIDVGYIEISSDTAASMTENEFLPLSRIRPFVDYWPTRVFLTGFPAGIVSLEAARRNRFHLDAIGYLTETKKLNDMEYKHDKSTDVFIDYEQNSVFVENQEVIQMPEPHGLSGGGLWALPITQGGAIWAPQETMLIGIERSRKSPNILCCTQIQHWLMSVAEGYSDLRETIHCYLQS